MPKKLLIAIALLVANAISAQNAPQTTLGSINEASSGSIQIPVTVTNFNDIGAIYLSIDYDHSVIQLTGATPNPQLPTLLYGDSDLGTGFHRVILGWYGNGLTLPDGSVIMTLIFNYLSGNTTLTFFENGPSCEYASAEGNVLNDSPTDSYYFNGRVCGAPGNSGTIFGASTVCRGAKLVSYSVTPNPNASDYTWFVPWGVEIVCGLHTNLILVNIANDAQEGNVQVSCSNPCNYAGTWSTLPLTLHDPPIANIQYIPLVPYGTSVTLHASPGGSGSYAYHWSPEAMLIDPDVQNPQTVNLFVNTIFNLVVTDLETGCQASGINWAQIAGGPLYTDPISYPDTICPGDWTKLYPMESGGSGSYTYAWTSNPSGWSSLTQYPDVNPALTTTYILTVSDGSGSVTDSTIVFVDDTVTAMISGLDTLCGTGDSAVLTIDLAGTPPWTFVYTFGSKSVLVDEQTGTPYNLVTGEKGTYTISYVQNNFCEGAGEGEGSVEQVPVPPAPVIQLIETTLVSDACCGNQWYHNDTAIPGGTGISYTASESGRYYDIVTFFSCVSDTSNAITVIIDGIRDNLADRLDIFPNPATDLIHGRFNMDDGRFNMDFKLEIFDVYGRSMKDSFMAEGSGEFELEVSSLSPGLYIVVMSSETGMLARKVVLQ
jgi:hypothetical protein